MTETIAVTGGNGRVGRAVLEHLSAEGYRTANLSRGKRDEPHSDAYLTTDLLDAGEVYGSVAKSDADAVVHLGMLPTPEATPGYRTFESNAMSSYHVLEAAGELGVETVTLASSFSAIGGGFEPDPITVDYLPVDESHRLTPSTPYGMGKQTLETVADGFARRDEGAPRTITSLRFPWVVDDEMARETFVETDRTLSGMRESGSLHGQRNTLFTYAHTSDVVDLVRRTVEASFDGHERVWVSAPDTSAETPSEELVAELFDDVTVRGDFPEDDHAALVDTSKATALFDWEPTWRWRQHD
ncbi:NAD-dependent epimerase/dehydratase family protein [Haloarcula nitratireducens]|uniref:NAD(P)-dependent oxidoreductase n=1 Tax=Haloarcula nitratireducens TaxID=2487749 RepID=A0AAW4PAX6_9EURY|nr:NAD(P)-dependent oxidoreductase [Halomicroarcula nitratireducens]MBX0294820.1 NAD(P)-dependent oxidoreductase [Halomicroarcula nitratireducens]